MVFVFGCGHEQAAPLWPPAGARAAKSFPPEPVNDPGATQERTDDPLGGLPANHPIRCPGHPTHLGPARRLRAAQSGSGGSRGLEGNRQRSGEESGQAAAAASGGRPNSDDAHRYRCRRARTPPLGNVAGRVALRSTCGLGERRRSPGRAARDMKWLLIGFLKAYRLLISPLYGNVCRYYPSCSAYALRAISVHGAAKGSWLATRRLLRCHPWAPGGYDPVPGTPEFAEEMRDQARRAAIPSLQRGVA